MKNRILKNSLRIIAAAILVQTLYFKFSGAPESIYIFTHLGIEPYGRIGSGIVELITARFSNDVWRYFFAYICTRN